MGRRAAALAAALLLAAALSGCSFAGLDAQALMRAPRPTGENEADIQNLLEQTAGDEMILKYPEAGQYHAAIVSHDLFGGGSGGAMAFYQKDENSPSTSVAFMRKAGGKWQNAGAFSTPAPQVDRVCFGDLDGDGRDEAVVGWGSGLNSTGSVCVYYYKNGRMNELRLNQNYTEMTVADLDGDGRAEIFTASVAAGDQPAEARLLGVRNEAVEVKGTAPLDTGVTKYASLKTGLVNEKQVGVVLDGIKAANVMTTEMLYWDAKKKSLQAPFYDPRTKTAKSTERATSVVSRDINGDKIIEIPIVTLMPGYSGLGEDEADYLTNWHRYDTATGTFVRVMSMVIDYADGYWFSIPDMWRGKITTKLDPATRTLHFYQWMESPKSPAGVRGPELLRIQAFTEKEWNARPKAGGFFLLTKKDRLCYAAACPSPASPLAMTPREVADAFERIPQD